MVGPAVAWPTGASFMRAREALLDLSPAPAVVQRFDPSCPLFFLFLHFLALLIILIVLVVLIGSCRHRHSRYCPNY